MHMLLFSGIISMIFAVLAFTYVHTVKNKLTERKMN